MSVDYTGCKKVWMQFDIFSKTESTSVNDSSGNKIKPVCGRKVLGFGDVTDRNSFT